MTEIDKTREELNYYWQNPDKFNNPSRYIPPVKRSEKIWKNVLL
jgi:hypothetical protein